MTDYNEKAKSAFKGIITFKQFNDQLKKDEQTESEKRAAAEKDDVLRRRKAFANIMTTKDE